MANKEFVSVLDALSDPVLQVDAQGRITLANAAAQDQFGSGLEGQYFARAIREPEALACVDRVLSGQKASEVIVSRNLPVRAMLKIRAVRLRRVKSLAARAVVTVTDVSHVYEAEQMRSDFVANVSHELRSPLTSMVSIIETLTGSARDDAGARERFLHVMQREASRMNRLIDDLLSLSTVEVNAHVRPTGTVDMVKLIRQIVNTIESRQDRDHVPIRLELPDSSTPIPGDEDELTQVFHNLIENAKKYARSDAPITISMRTFEEAAGFQDAVQSISVRDRGPGIAPEHIPRLTERFYRVDAGRSRDQGGTGLGLAIVKHIVNRHRGRLLIESEVDIGSTFTVHLPMA